MLMPMLLTPFGLTSIVYNMQDKRCAGRTTTIFTNRQDDSKNTNVKLKHKQVILVKLGCTDQDLSLSLGFKVTL